MIDVSEINAISASGAVGEILGHFYNAKGQRIDNGLTARTMTIPLDLQRRDNIVPLAGGQRKYPPSMRCWPVGLLMVLLPTN